MHIPLRLPSEFAARPFTTREALESGITPGQLRNRALEKSFCGLRNAESIVPLEQQCAMIALRLRDEAFFSHGTAARIHGMPLPLRLERDPVLQVGVPAPSRAPHAARLRGHQSRVTDGDLSLVCGIRLTSVERTWCDLAEILELRELVAAGDYAIHWRQPLTTQERIAESLARRSSVRNIRILRHAFDLLDDHSESPPESVLRVILVEGGAPAIRVNHAVTDRFGEFVARTDLIVDEWKLVLEYQGDYHRKTKGQWRADMTRRSRLESNGWRVMEVNADDLRDPVELMERIRRRVDAAV